MTRVALLPVLFAVPAFAAPIPPESDRDKVARLWGKVESPPGEYGARPHGDKLTLRSLGWPLRFRHAEPLFRITREATGDFDVRVTVEALDAPDKTVKYDGSYAETGAGIRVWGGEHSVSAYRWKGYPRFNAQQRDADPPMQAMIWVEQSLGRQGGQGSGSSVNDPNAAVELRVVRQKEAITVYTREAGKDWRQSTVRADLKLPETVTVGLFVGHSTSMPCEATFAGYAVGKPEAKKDDKSK